MIIPLFLPMEGCPFQCVYCDQGSITGQGGGLTPREVQALVEEGLARVKGGDPPPEVAFYGGTFTALSPARQEELLQAVAPYLQRGLVGALRLSTRPDAIDDEILDRLWRWGVGTIELGVQSLDPQVLAASGRGYGPEAVEKSAQAIRQRGFRLGLQLMVGLPGDTLERARESARRTIALKPGFVRVYPALVLEGAPLARAYRAGEYRPWTLAQAVAVGADLMELFGQARIPVARWGLQTEAALTAAVVAGPWHPAYGELVRQEWLSRRLEEALVRCWLRLDPGAACCRQGLADGVAPPLARLDLPDGIAPRSARLDLPSRYISWLKGHGAIPWRRLQSRWPINEWRIIQRGDSIPAMGWTLAGPKGEPLAAAAVDLSFLEEA